MYGFVVTTAGEGLLARAAGGEALTITGTRVGSGSVAGESAARALTALIQDQAAGTYSTPEVSGGQLSMVVEYRNNLNGGLQTGFTLREFGVFARVGDDAPTLMYYAALGDRAPEVPPITEGLDVHRWPVAVAVSGELAVTVEDPSGAFVGDSELQKYLPLAGGTMTGPLALDALQVGTKGKGVVVGLDNAGTLETPVVQMASQYGSGPAVLRGVAQAQQSGDALPKGQADGAYLPKSQKGQPGGVASLDGEGKVPGEQLPEMNYVQNITRTATVAAGQSIQAGDVVDLNEAGQIVKTVEAQANVETIFDSNTGISGIKIIKLSDKFCISTSISSAKHQLKCFLLNAVTGGKISEGSAYSGDNDSVSAPALARLDDTRFVVGYIADGFLYGKIGTVSGTSISFGEEQTISNSYVPNKSVEIISLSSELAVFFACASNGVRALVHTVSGTELPFSASSNLHGTSAYDADEISATLLPDDESGNKRVCVCFSDTGDGNKGKAVLAKIDSSNAVTWGEVITWNDSVVTATSCCFDGEYVIVAARDTSTIRAIGVDDDLFIAGNPYSVQPVDPDKVSVIMVGAEIVFIFYDGRTAIEQRGARACVIQNDSGVLSSGPEFVFNPDALASGASSASISENRFIVAYADTGNYNRGTCTILTVNGDQIAGEFVMKSSQAIALEDGGAGESIELLFSGTAELPGIAAGTRISGDSGVQGYAPVDGWLYATPYWASPQVILGSYAGTGTYGADSPNTLTFPFEPKLVLICPKNNWNMGIFARGIERVGATWQQGSGRTSIVTWNENGLEWYSNDGSSYQFNSEGTTYIYLAIG